MSRLTLPLAVILLAALVVALHLRGTAQAPLPDYGWRGAPYLEHTQRAYALNLLEGLSPQESLKSLPRHLVALDGEYPALLHALSARGGHALGEGGADGSIQPHWGYVLAQGLLWLSMVILGGLLGLRGLDGLMDVDPEEGSKEAAEDEWAGENEWAGESHGKADPEWRLRALVFVIAALGTPGLFATARRYYYDLPMAAWLSLFGGGLFLGYRRPGGLILAGLALGLACLTKWHALLYALWPLVFVVGLGIVRGEGRKGLGAALSTTALGAVVAMGPWLLDGDVPESLYRLLGEADIAMTREMGSIPLGIGRLALGGAWSMTGLGTLATLGLFAILNLRGPGDASANRYPLGLGLIAVVVLGPIVTLGATVPAPDARFLLPLIMPLLMAIVFMARRWSLVLMGVALFMVGTAQIIDVDATPLGLTRPPLGQRGWSRPGENRGSDPQAYLDITAMLCDRQHPRGITALPMDPVVDREDGLAWRWAIARRCPRLGVVVIEDPPWGLSSKARGNQWQPIKTPKSRQTPLGIKAPPKGLE